MNIDDMLYEEDTLEEKYEQVENYCIMLDERARMSKVNQLDNKVTQIFGMTIIPYVLLLITSILYFGFTDLELLTPALLSNLTLGSVGISLPIGYISSSLINKKYKIKQRFKEFSNSKKEREKIELQLSNELQLERMKNRNLVLCKAIDKKNTNELNITDLSKYKDLEMSVIPKDLEKVLKDKQKIEKELEKKYNELDVLSVKKYLGKNMGKYILKGQDIMEIFVNSFMFGVMPFLLIFMPTILLAKLQLPIPSILANIQLSVLGISVTSTTSYNFMKNRIQKKYFKRINDLLGDNKFSENKDNLYDENNKINELIEQKILEVSNLELKKEECQRSLETIGTKEEIEQIIECYINNFSKQKEETETQEEKEVAPVYKKSIYEKLEKQKVKTLKK